jgi:hypothetical protein
MTNSSSKDNPLPDPYLREIGRTAVEWSKVEAAIETIIWVFLFIDFQETSPWHREPEGRAVTTHVNLLLRVDMMLSLASATTSKTLTSSHPPFVELQEIARETRALYPKRNKCVHGLWSPIGSMALRQSYRARGDVSPFYDVMDLDDLRAVADECAALAKKIDKCIMPLTAYVRELRTRWYEREKK